MKWQKEIFEYLLIFLPYLMFCLIKGKGKPFIRREQHWIAIRVLRNFGEFFKSGSYKHRSEVGLVQR